MRFWLTRTRGARAELGVNPMLPGTLASDSGSMRAVEADSHWPPLSAMFCFALVTLAGVWLIISPRVLNYPSGAPQVVSEQRSGAILVILAPAAMLLVRRFRGLGWACVLVGAWVLASLLFLPNRVESSTIVWNEVLIGALVCELSGWATDATPLNRRKARR